MPSNPVQPFQLSLNFYCPDENFIFDFTCESIWNWEIFTNEMFISYMKCSFQIWNRTFSRMKYVFRVRNDLVQNFTSEMLVFETLVSHIIK